MDGFSVTSLTTTCSSVSQRAIASAAEIRTLQQDAGSEEEPRLRGLVALAGLLDEASRSVLQLEQTLNAATAVAERLRVKLDEALKASEGAIASLNKQIMGLQTSNLDQLSATYIGKQKNLLSAHNQLFGFYTRLLTAEDGIQQNKGLDTKDMMRLDELATQAVNEAKQLPNTILAENHTFTSLSSMIDDLPPAYDEAGPSGSAHGPSSPQEGDDDGGWLKSSFTALMSSIMPKPDPLLGALCEAVAQGHTRHVGALISQGANVNGRNESRETPLQVAIRVDNAEMANMLVAAGANIKTGTGNCLPALFEAAAAGKVALAKVFLDQGADLHQKNTSGQSYFYNVVERGNAHGVKFLLEQGANVHAKSISGRPSLAEAVRKENCELVQLLLSYGAKITSKDINGASLLSIAVANQNVELVKLLLEHEASADSKNVSGSYVLAEAIALRNLPIAGLLFDYGADGKKSTISGQPLIIVVIKDKNLLKADREYFAQRLLECGANPNAKDMSNSTPALQFALKAGQSEIVRLLLEHDAKTTGTMESGETLLMYAVSNGTPADVRALLKAGADPSDKGKSEMLPLMQAVIKQDKEMIRVLREYGATVGESAIAFAAAIQQPDILQALGVSAAPSPAPAERLTQPRAAPDAPPAYDAVMKS